MALKIPTRTERRFIENRGEHRNIEVEDRPFRRAENQFIEHKGCYEDVDTPLTDYEILESGGLEAWFNPDGSRKAGLWPVDESEDEVDEEEFPTMEWTKAQLIAFAGDHLIQVDAKSTKKVLLETIESEFE